MNKITFLVPCTLEFYVGIDTETEEPIIETEEVKQGQSFDDVDVSQANSDNLWEVEFGDGSVTYVAKSVVEIS